MLKEHRFTKCERPGGECGVTQREWPGGCGVTQWERSGGDCGSLAGRNHEESVGTVIGRGEEERRV